MTETKEFPTAVVYTLGNGKVVGPTTFRPYFEAFAWIFGIEEAEDVNPSLPIIFGDAIKRMVSDLYPEMCALETSGVKSKEEAEAFVSMLVEKYGAELKLPRLLGEGEGV